MSRRWRYTPLALLAALTGCEHTAPFRPEAYGPDGPFAPDSSRVLTLNRGQDLTPAWLPDGGTIVYSAERLDRADRDRCLAFLPAGGGAISRYACRTAASDDSINAFEEPAPRGDSVAFLRAAATRTLARLGPDVLQLVIGPVDRPAAGRAVLAFPLTTSWGATYEAASFIQWLDAGRLVMIADTVRYPRPCSSCAPDTLALGVEIVTLDVAAASAPARVPGTAGATSLSVSGDTMYFTLDGDSQVHRYLSGSGQAGIAYDFGAGRIVRDVAVRGGRLIAVVDGHRADGGVLHLVNLATGADSTLPMELARQPYWFERPALSPDARHVVAQARSLVLIPIYSGDVLIGVDTSAASDRNLWRLDLP